MSFWFFLDPCASRGSNAPPPDGGRAAARLRLDALPPFLRDRVVLLDPALFACATQPDRQMLCTLLTQAGVLALPSAADLARDLVLPSLVVDSQDPRWASSDALVPLACFLRDCNAPVRDGLRGDLWLRAADGSRVRARDAVLGEDFLPAIGVLRRVFPDLVSVIGGPARTVSADYLAATSAAADRPGDRVAWVQFLRKQAGVPPLFRTEIKSWLSSVSGALHFTHRSQMHSPWRNEPQWSRSQEPNAHLLVVTDHHAPLLEGVVAAVDFLVRAGSSEAVKAAHALWDLVLADADEFPQGWQYARVTSPVARPPPDLFSSLALALRAARWVPVAGADKLPGGRCPLVLPPPLVLWQARQTRQAHPQPQPPADLAGDPAGEVPAPLAGCVPLTPPVGRPSALSALFPHTAANACYILRLVADIWGASTIDEDGPGGVTEPANDVSLGLSLPSAAVQYAYRFILSDRDTVRKAIERQLRVFVPAQRESADAAVWRGCFLPVQQLVWSDGTDAITEKLGLLRILEPFYGRAPGFVERDCDGVERQTFQRIHVNSVALGSDLLLALMALAHPNQAARAPWAAGVSTNALLLSSASSSGAQSALSARHSAGQRARAAAAAAALSPRERRKMALRVLLSIADVATDLRTQDDTVQWVGMMRNCSVLPASPPSGGGAPLWVPSHCAMLDDAEDILHRKVLPNLPPGWGVIRLSSAEAESSLPAFLKLIGVASLSRCVRPEVQTDMVEPAPAAVVCALQGALLAAQLELAQSEPYSFADFSPRVAEGVRKLGVLSTRRFHVVLFLTLPGCDPQPPPRVVDKAGAQYVCVVRGEQMIVRQGAFPAAGAGAQPEQSQHQRPQQFFEEIVKVITKSAGPALELSATAKQRLIKAMMHAGEYGTESGAIEERDAALANACACVASGSALLHRLWRIEKHEALVQEAKRVRQAGKAGRGALGPEHGADVLGNAASLQKEASAQPWAADIEGRSESMTQSDGGGESEPRALWEAREARVQPPPAALESPGGFRSPGVWPLPAPRASPRRPPFRVAAHASAADGPAASAEHAPEHAPATPTTEVSEGATGNAEPVSGPPRDDRAPGAGPRLEIALAAPPAEAAAAAVMGVLPLPPRQQEQQRQQQFGVGTDTPAGRDRLQCGDRLGAIGSGLHFARPTIGGAGAAVSPLPLLPASALLYTRTGAPADACFLEVSPFPPIPLVSLPPVRDCGTPVDAAVSSRLIASSATAADIGRRGEMAVVEYLRQTFGAERVHWANEDGESGGAFDVELLMPHGPRRLIEVKTTSDPDPARRFQFVISASEIVCAHEAASHVAGPAFDVYRVLLGGDPGKPTLLFILENFYELLHRHQFVLVASRTGGGNGSEDTPRGSAGDADSCFTLTKE